MKISGLSFPLKRTVEFMKVKQHIAKKTVIPT